MNLGAPELIIILIVVLLIFGGSRLPKLARSLGKAQSEFKKGVDEGADDDDAGDDDAGGVASEGRSSKRARSNNDSND